MISYNYGVFCNVRRWYLIDFLKQSRLLELMIFLIFAGKEFHRWGPKQRMLLLKSVVRNWGQTKLTLLPLMLCERSTNLKAGVPMQLFILLNIINNKKYLWILWKFRKLYVENIVSVESNLPRLNIHLKIFFCDTSTLWRKKGQVHAQSETQ